MKKLKEFNYAGLDDIGLKVLHSIKDAEEIKRIQDYKKENGHLPHDVCGNEKGEFLTTSPDLDVRDIDLYVKIKTAH